MAPELKCMCGEKWKWDCPGEWEQGCDLGANEKYVSVVSLDPEKEKILKQALRNDDEYKLD